MRRLGLFLLLASATASADPLPPEVRAHATRKTTSISVDGHLDEAAWANAPKQGGFTERFPKDGVKSAHDTEFALLYDDNAIYVGVWCNDLEPSKIRRTLTRRDADALADAVLVGIDSYHDRRTAYVFQVNAAGVQRDMLIFDDSQQDDTWDAVWTANVAMTPQGWTAELRIPLNQLRFSGDNQEWGFQVLRMVARDQEQSTWSPWPRTSNTVVSKFGVVDGIDVHKPSSRLELLPYASGGVQSQTVDPGDPLNPHTSALGNLGLDLKYGLGPAFTLSATINPDFGQVEADPSQVNLSTTELFFQEKRPFFLEGIDLFKLPMGNGDNLIEGAFYSRRIGAAPPEPDMDYQYIKQPTSTTIYSAAKLTGKQAGWSVGLLDAVTGEENATIVDDAGTMSKPVVAPLTNYAVGRVKHDYRGGNTTVGASATAVNRSLDGTPLEALLHDQAYTGGLQLTHRWWDSAWEADIHGVTSYVHGTKEALLETQQENRHLFQRPDASDITLDPNRTSMAGAGLTWTVGRSGQTKHWRWAQGGDLRTPGLEVNDLGYQQTSDRLEPWWWTEYREDNPGDTLLNWRVNAVQFYSSTLEPRMLTYGTNEFASAQLTNYWRFFAGSNLQMPGWDVMEMRGGNALRMDTRLSGFGGFSTDNRKMVRIDFNLNAFYNFGSDAMQFGMSTGAFVQARSNIDVWLGLDWFQRSDPMQYIDQIDDESGRRHFLFGSINQTTSALTTRVNWTFSPHLSLQVYAQPFIAAGNYSEYKDVDNPHATHFADRFHELAGNDYNVMDGTVTVSHNGTYSFDKPDFDIQQLRSTVVLRWEYRPGSTVFAIWSHGRSDSLDSRFDLANDVAHLASAPGEHIVMVKANYWIGL